MAPLDSRCDDAMMCRYISRHIICMYLLVLWNLYLYTCISQQTFAAQDGDGGGARFSSPRGVAVTPGGKAILVAGTNSQEVLVVLTS